MHDTETKSVHAAAPPVYHELPVAGSVQEACATIASSPLALPLRSMVLLSGSVWVSGLRAAVQRSLLDLPVTRDKTLLEFWWQRVAELGKDLGLPELPLKVLVTQGFPSPVSGLPHLPVVIQRDAAAYRGTGGALRDLAQAEPSDGYILVAHASQLPLVPLAPLVTKLMGLQADFALSAHVDGTAGRLMLIRCGCLRVLPRIGFVDLMEQGLRMVSAEHRVKALKCGASYSLPIRTFSGYIAALQQYHRQLGGPNSFQENREQQQPDAQYLHVGREECGPSFALVEPGAQVHPSACLHDAVVLRGARIGRNAIVARSVICPGASVTAGSTVVDQLVTSANG